MAEAVFRNAGKRFFENGVNALLRLEKNMAIFRVLFKTILLASVLFGIQEQGRCDLVFDFFSIHPDAAAQPTVRGSTLSSIEFFQDELYFGYGDWAADTGPIAIRSLNPSTGTWSPKLLSLDTEAITHFRPIGSSLYAVNVDPLGPPGVNPGGYALGTSNGFGSTSWRSVSNIPATHSFDISGGTGNDLWVVGSSGTLGAIWRSVDGGQTFNVARLDGPAAGSPPFVFSRYTGVAEYMGLLYVQRVDVNGSHVSSSLVFDGSSWTNGPDLISASNGSIFRPQQFDGQLVYFDGDLGNKNLYRFDGTQSALAYTEPIRDFYVTNGILIALSASGEIISTRDLNSWTTLGLAPTNSQSLAFNSDFIFVGTSTAQVFRAESSSITAVPEPSIWQMFAVTILFAGTVAFRRYRREIPQA